MREEWLVNGHFEWLSFFNHHFKGGSTLSCLFLIVMDDLIERQHKLMGLRYTGEHIYGPDSYDYYYASFLKNIFGLNRDT